MLLLESVGIGILIGLLAGALGIGGGILAVPALVYLLGQDPHTATAESLVIIIVTSAAALPSRFKAHQVQLQAGLIFGVYSALGAIAGSKLNIIINADVIMFAFATLILAVSLLMLRNGLATRREENSGITIASKEAADTSIELSLRHLPAIFALGTFTGAMVGFFGIGGGFAMVPILVLIMRYPMKVASGTSFIVILVVSAISLTTRVTDAVNINWLVALLFATGSGIGSAIGSPLSNKAKASTLTFIFCLLLLSTSIFTYISTLRSVL